MPLHPSVSPLAKRAAEISKLAGDDYLRNGTDPSVAIAKFANELFSDDFTHLVAAKTNRYIFDVAFEKIAKRHEWNAPTVATIRAAISGTEKTAAASEISPVWKTRLNAPAYLSKLAERNGPGGAKIDQLGWKVLKFAEPNYDEFNRNRAGREFLEVEHLSSLEKDAEFREQKASVDALEAIEKHFEKFATKNSELLFDEAINIASKTLEKAAAALLIDSCIRKMAESGKLNAKTMAIYDENLKTASVDFLESGYPVLRNGEHIILKINTLISEGRNREKFPHKDTSGYQPAGFDQRVRYKVEAVTVPRASRSYTQRDAEVNGFRLF